MAFGTPNSQAIAIANALIDIAQQLVAQKTLIDHYGVQYQELALGTIFGALGTVAVNPDGTAGEPDATPNPANPIDPGKYPNISRLISADELGSLNTLLGAVSTLLSGAAVTQQGQAPQLLAKLVGGEEDSIA